MKIQEELTARGIKYTHKSIVPWVNHLPFNVYESDLLSKIRHTKEWKENAHKIKRLEITAATERHSFHADYDNCTIIVEWFVLP